MAVQDLKDTLAKLTDNKTNTSTTAATAAEQLAATQKNINKISTPQVKATGGTTTIATPTVQNQATPVGDAVTVRDTSGKPQTGYIRDGKTYIVSNGQEYRIPVGWEVDAGNGKTYVMTQNGGVEKTQPIADTTSPALTGDTGMTTSAQNSDAMQSLIDNITNSLAPIQSQLDALTNSRKQSSQLLGQITDPAYLQKVTAEMMTAQEPLIRQRTEALMTQRDEALRQTLSDLERRGIVASGAASVIENQVRDAYSGMVDDMIAEIQSNTQALAGQQIDRIMQSINMQGDWAGQDLNSITNAITSSLGTQLDATQLQQQNEQFYAGLKQDDRQFYDSLDQDQQQFVSSIGLQYAELGQDAQQFAETMAFNIMKHKDDIASAAASRQLSLDMFNAEMQADVQKFGITAQFQMLDIMDAFADNELNANIFADEQARNDAAQAKEDMNYIFDITGLLTTMSTQGATETEMRDFANGMMDLSGISGASSYMNDFISSLANATPEEINTALSSSSLRQSYYVNNPSRPTGGLLESYFGN